MVTFVGIDADGKPLKRKQSRTACSSCRARKAPTRSCPFVTAVESGDVATILDVARVHASTAQAKSATIEVTNEALPSTFLAVNFAIARLTSRLQKRCAHYAEDCSNSNGPKGGFACQDAPSRIQEGGHATMPVSAALTTSGDHEGHVSDEEQEQEQEQDPSPRFVGELNPEGTFVTAVSPTVATATAAGASSANDVVGIWVPRKLVEAVNALSGPILPILLPYLEDECRRALPDSVNYNSIYQLYLKDFHPILPVVNLDTYQKRSDRSKTLLQLAICLCMSSNSKAATHLQGASKDFAAQVPWLIRSAIDNGIVKDKQVIIQLLILLGLGTQLSGDHHGPAEVTYRAISYVHTCGLQLDTSNSHSDDLFVSRLFCCAYVLDRLNAAIQGRPVLMHERDLGRDMTVCVQKQDGLFQLLLRVTLLLDKVITLYRPSTQRSRDAAEASETIQAEFPAFEDLLATCGTIRAPLALIATVETMYHAVSMLSYRSQSLTEPTTDLAAYTRQKLSAASIVNIAGSEYKNQLSLLPFVPYALSLALRTTYRDLRLSRSSFTRTRSRGQLLHVCSLIRSLGNSFSSALHMCDLAQQTIYELDKVCWMVLGQKKHNETHSAPETDGGASRLGTMASQDRQEHEQNTTVKMSAVGDDLEIAATLTTAADIYAVQSGNSVGLDLDPDLDIFEYFDPSFDIGAVDAALANNIDLSMQVDIVPWDLHPI